MVDALTPARRKRHQLRLWRPIFPIPLFEGDIRCALEVFGWNLETLLLSGSQIPSLQPPWWMQLQKEEIRFAVIKSTRKRMRLGG